METEIAIHNSTTVALSRIHEALEQASTRYAEASHAMATKEAYAKDWRAFTGWCDKMGLSALPADPSTVVLYMTFRAELGRKPSVLDRELTTISIAHTNLNLVSPRQHPDVRRLMKGIRRTKGTRQRQATPLLPKSLRAISAGLPDKLAASRDRALLLIGFAGAFRRSELVALKIEDVTFVDNGLEIWLRRSKTDQDAKGQKKGIPFGSDPATCPVRALRAWLAESHLKMGSIFRPIDKYGNVRMGTLSDRSVARIVKQRAAEIGLPSELMSGHSLRSGLATAAAQANKSANDIMRQTGHKSLNMVQKYIREATLFNNNAASGIGL
jgi:integrase